jgi:hypothetical protein
VLPRAQLELACHAFASDTAADTAGPARAAAYLVRPGGHVALALPDQDIVMLTAYASNRGHTFTSVA